MPQATLFALPDPVVLPAANVHDYDALAARVPTSIRLGGMSWNYPGWRGHVFDKDATLKDLPRYGLAAYAQHPLFRAVEIDRSAYDPLAAPIFRAFADQTPDDFRFSVKAHDHLTMRRFPLHARFGKLRGEPSPHYFDAAYATDTVIGPTVEGLGAKLGVLLFQCPPQDVGEPPEAFADRVHEFLVRLPRGIPYAVELRNRELFTGAYAQALADAGALHCHNIRQGVPTLLEQVRLIPPPARRPLIVRWLMHPTDSYEDARDRYTPFDKLVDEDRATRASIVNLVKRATEHEVDTIVLVDNKAEGCAPESLIHLATDLARPLDT